MATTDPLALLRIGPRGAASKAASARGRAVLAELRDADRRITLEIAEAFAVDAVLRNLAPPAVDADPAPFLAAGLASETDAARLAAARRAHAAETRTIEAERTANLARLRRLLGLGADAHLELVPPEGDVPPRPAPTREMLLRRPDLATALRRYEAADAEFREKVWEQYPSLRLGPRVPFSPGSLNPLVGLDVPIGAAGPARAARARREAAFHEVEAALLDAEEELRALEAELEAAEARAQAKRAAADAMEAALAVALRRLEIEADAFPEVAEMSGRAVMESADARMAEVEAVRARARFARACGWPFPENEEEDAQ